MTSHQKVFDCTFLQIKDFCIFSQYSQLDTLYRIIIIAVIVVMTVIEVIRLYLGYLGNLSEQVRNVIKLQMLLFRQFYCHLLNVILKGDFRGGFGYPWNIHFLIDDSIILTSLSAIFTHNFKDIINQFC